MKACLKETFGMVFQTDIFPVCSLLHLIYENARLIEECSLGSLISAIEKEDPEQVSDAAVATSR
jgi:hypothetical protein